MERQRQEYDLGRGPEIIYLAVRRQIDVSLLATGDSAFGPVRKLVETLDAYLGPVLKFSDGMTSLAGVVQKLRKALVTDKKKVVEEKTDGHHGAVHVHGQGAFTGQGGSTVIIATPPAGPNGLMTGVDGQTTTANVAAAAAVGPGGGVQVVQPARVFEIPSHGLLAQPGGAPAKPIEKEVDLSSRERSQALREALEALSDYWQKERVETELRAAQRALNITRAIGEKEGLLPRNTRPPPATPSVNSIAAKAARDANRGFLGILGL
jgi:hypothetical protein